MENAQTHQHPPAPRPAMKHLFRVVLVCCWVIAGAAFAWGALYKDPQGVYCTYTAGTDLVANWSVNGTPCHIRGTFYFLAAAFGLAFGTGMAVSIAYIFVYAEMILRRLLSRS